MKKLVFAAVIPFYPLVEHQKVRPPPILLHLRGVQLAFERSRATARGTATQRQKFIRRMLP